MASMRKWAMSHFIQFAKNVETQLVVQNDRTTEENYSAEVRRCT
jgi:hypothetical protein